jgi:excisionase family DNA binding protein
VRARGYFFGANMQSPPLPVEDHSLLTVKEAAQLLRVSLGCVYALCASGELPHYRLGNGQAAIRISKADLLDYMERCRSGNVSERHVLPFPERESRPLPHSVFFKHLRLREFVLPGEPLDANDPRAD